MISNGLSSTYHFRNSFPSKAFVQRCPWKSVDVISSKASWSSSAYDLFSVCDSTFAFRPRHAAARERAKNRFCQITGKEVQGSTRQAWLRNKGELWRTMDFPGNTAPKSATTVPLSCWIGKSDVRFMFARTFPNGEPASMHDGTWLRNVITRHWGNETAHIHLEAIPVDESANIATWQTLTRQNLFCARSLTEPARNENRALLTCDPLNFSHYFPSVWWNTYNFLST